MRAAVIEMFAMSPCRRHAIYVCALFLSIVFAMTRHTSAPRALTRIYASTFFPATHDSPQRVTWRVRVTSMAKQPNIVAAKRRVLRRYIYAARDDVIPHILCEREKSERKERQMQANAYAECTGNTPYVSSAFFLHTPSPPSFSAIP